MAISISFYLDTRYEKQQDGERKEFPIKLRITKNRTTAQLPTGIMVEKEQWKNNRVVGRPDKSILNQTLDNLRNTISSITIREWNSGRYVDMSITEIRDDIRELLDPASAQKASTTPSFLSLYDSFAEERSSDRTKEIYRVTGRKIRALVRNAEGIHIDEVTLDWLEDFDERLIAKGNNGSTRNIDFRNIKAVIRYSIKHKHIHENPFDFFEMPETSSPDRALTLPQFKKFINAELEPWERKYMDFFLLSFLLIGINTEDLLHLTQIEDGRINYVRAKTHKPLSIKVEPEAMAIINKYRGTDYLLNILNCYCRTHNWTAKVDAALKRIARRNDLPDITMYWARHSWATFAHADLGVELSTVSDALGHQPEKKVTLIYIRRKNFNNIDAANRKVIDYCFYGKIV